MCLTFFSNLVIRFLLKEEIFMPQEKLSITERLEIYAEAGETSAPLKLWTSEISKLEKGGFSVEKIAPVEGNMRFLCDIDWKYPKGKDAQQMLDYTIKALQNNFNVNN